jgi:hypothetical protein
MKSVFKSIILGALAISAFSCKDKEIDKPDSLIPVKVTIEDILTGKFNDQTVMIDSVYFDHIAGTKFNGTTSNGSGSRIIRDCESNSLIVFTYASDDWSYENVPSGPNSMGPIYGVISEFNGVFQLLMRSIDDVKEMTKPKCPEKLDVITIAEFLANDYTGKLVKILDVEFDVNATNYGNGKFNGTTSNANGSKTVKDCFGNSTIVFTFTSDAWSNEPLPLGNGPIIAVGGLFNTTKQLLIRSLNDVAGMINANCSGGGGGGGGCTDYFCDDFEGGTITANNAWVIKEVANPGGLQSWVYGTINGNYARATNWNGSINQTADWWLISPAINLSGATAPKLNFDMVKRYVGDNIEVKISTNYDGTSAPSTATWTDITSLFTLDSNTGSWDFTNSGNGDITAYKAASVRIAFRYIGGTTNGSTWQIDNVVISE